MILEVDNLCKKWDGFKLDNINLTLKSGYVMGLVGRSGSGKTTCINGILASIKINKGDIKIDGIDHKKIEAREKRAFVLDEAPFFKFRTLIENADIFKRFYPMWDDKEFRKNLTQYELNSRARYNDLSKGMKIKFQLAFALSTKSKLLIMDEPTGGLDPVFRRDFLSIIQDYIYKENASVLMSTHITSDLDKIADYITMLDEGQQIFTMTKEELMDYYPIVHGKIEDLHLIKHSNPKRIRRTADSFETILEDYKVVNEDKFQGRFIMTKPSIEEIMYYFSEPLL